MSTFSRPRTNATRTRRDLSTMISEARSAISMLAEAIAEGYDDETITEFGDLADDAIDAVADIDTRSAERLNATISGLAA